MKVHLMDPECDFDPDATDPPFADDLVQDLELDYLFDAMAGGDGYARKVARAALLHPAEEETIRYRQDAYQDVCRNPDPVIRLTEIADEALKVRHRHLMFAIAGMPQSQLSYAVEVLTELLEQLERLRRWGAEVQGRFGSVALREFVQTVVRELDDDYLRLLRATLRELRFSSGLLMCAGIGTGGEVVEPVLRRAKTENRHLFDRTPLKRPFYAFSLPERDESGARELSHLRDRAVNDVANAAVQAAEHIMGYFSTVKAECTFYLGARRLAAVLGALGLPCCLPVPEPLATAAGLYDPCLALRSGAAPVLNDVALGTKRLLVITGANRGGKSTLLRALGVAQLMMQAGVIAPARGFTAPVAGRVYTHWEREEDAELVSGKLDEELRRMEAIVAAIRPGDLLLCNESFASTNEAEGSQILREVVEPLLAGGVTVFCVTHLYDFADGIAREAGLDAGFLSAPRGTNGERNFRLEPGTPLRTSYGLDLYDRVFGTTLAALVPEDAVVLCASATGE